MGENCTPTVVHQKKKNKKNPWNRRELENNKDLGSHTQKCHNTRRILQLNFMVFFYLHTSVLQLYGFYSSNLSVIAAISHTHEWSHSKLTLAASGTAQHLSGDQQNSRLYFSPQSSSKTPLFRDFQLGHTSQLCQRAHHVISMIKPRLHRTGIASHLCVLCIFSSCFLASFGLSSCPFEARKWAILQDMGCWHSHVWYHFHMDGRGQSSSWNEAEEAQVSARLS